MSGSATSGEGQTNSGPVSAQKIILAAAFAVMLVGGGLAIGFQNHFSTRDVAEKGPTLPDNPSIAVHPFVNMSGEPEQEYFSDGISETIITDLSKLSNLFVIARNSTLRNKRQSG
jgi:hypothetical protein